jgi:hypothetical protein
LARQHRQVAESRLQRLIGTWQFEARVAGEFMGTGKATFEWMEDEKFVLERVNDVPSEEASADWMAHSPMPVTAVIGFDDTTHDLAMLYADARGVFRIYRMSLTEDSWLLERAAPGFHQRFTGTFGDDGQTIEGRWDSSPYGSTWEPDFDLTYRKVPS